MTPVMQTRFGEEGNCMTACIASLLDLPIESVPYFLGEDDFFGSVSAFLESKGYEYHSFIKGDEIEDWKKAPGVDGYFIVAGESPRMPGVQHAVIFKGQEMFFDPHPDKTGILTVDWIDDIRKREC